MKVSARPLFLACLLTAALAVALPASAGAYVYWTSPGGTIGRAGNDGSGANPKLITGAESGEPLAVDAGHLYYSASEEDEVGNPLQVRTNLDGGETLLLPEASVAESGEGIATVDSSHVYWVKGDSIGRAKLDGTDREAEFLVNIGAEPAPGGIAVYDGYIYWADYDGGFGSAIGRANLSTKEITPEFIDWDESTGPEGIAVGAAGIFWVNSSDGTIGRAAPAKGSEPDLDAILGASASSLGLALDDSGLYWFNYHAGDATSALAHANFGGSGSSTANFHYIDGVGGVWLAVNSATTPPPPPPPPPPGSSPAPAPIPSPILRKPLRCKKGFKKKSVKGKARCVKVNKHRHHAKP